MLTSSVTLSILAYLLLHLVSSSPVQPPAWAVSADDIDGGTTLSTSYRIVETPSPLESGLADLPTETPSPTSMPNTRERGIVHYDDDICMPTISKQCSFLDNFNDTRQTERWMIAHNYANGQPFDVWWSKSNAIINTAQGRASLVLNRKGSPNFGKRYTSGHFLTKNWYGYGCYETRMKPPSQSGLVSAFFAYAGKWDRPPAGSGRHNEIDLEFIVKPGRKKVSLQANYFTNGQGGHEQLIPLAFDPVERFHNYAFKWTSKGLFWYVDGKEVHSANDNIPKESDTTLRIMMNMWTVTERASSWAGTFRFRRQLKAEYDAVRFTKGEDCRIKGF